MNVTTIVIGMRKCGKRRPGLYLEGGTEPSKDGVLDRFTLIDPPIKYDVPHHRAPRLVDAVAVLSRSPMEDWWVGSAKEREIKKSGEQWEIDLFGMPLRTRINIGVCEGASNAEDALHKIVGHIEFHHGIAGVFRDLTQTKIQEVKACAPIYVELNENLAHYVDRKSLISLVAISSSVWKLAFALPPNKKTMYVPTLSRMLVLLNLRADASAMLNMLGSEWSV